MGQLEHSENVWPDYEQANQTLKKSIEKLRERSQKEFFDHYGLSETFESSQIDFDTAMGFCVKAMEALGSQYVDQFSLFQSTEEPLKALEYLEKAEVIWMKEEKVIRSFDAEGGETGFLSQIRETAMEILESKLEEAAKTCSCHATVENMALCIGIMAVMDQILEEQKVPAASAPRVRLRKIIKSFNTSLA